ncbi:MAG: aminodeoxychorismate lyase [Thiobacillus sp.]|uniref:aminodeoxychorismate lyase n=1 Tax=Thiobacillus sp. TaxID=924 RepID=UPI0027329AEA|nr:aminodeoxychorismate lyase [Thiobacillus sp.]MDP3583766.1 aminodeoxychorismate lyase [Thiobacillus sp.]
MTLVNGQPCESIDAHDRGLAYGDGVFRTLRTQAGQPLWWSDHYATLAADCAALKLACPDEAVLHREACAVAEAGAGVVKIVITRGVGVRGYAPSGGQAVTRLVLSAPLPPHAGADASQAITARWCSLQLARQPRLAGIKHLNRLENVLARAEWDDPAIIEGLLCDTDGMVIGGVMSNLFWARDGVLFTPDLGQCGVAGVARTRLLRAAARRGIPTRIERLPPAAILAADELMICNSLIGVRRVARLGDANWSPTGWTDTLNAALYEDN